MGNMIPRKYFFTEKDYANFLLTEKEWMYNRIHKSIEESFINDCEVSEIMEVNIEESDSLITLNLFRDEWPHSLDLALIWYQEQEMYEICADILSLKQEIEKHDGY